MRKALKIYMVNMTTSKSAYSKNIAAYTVNEAILIACNKLGITLSKLTSASVCVVEGSRSSRYE